jgi:hypothetical protein
MEMGLDQVYAVDKSLSKEGQWIEGDSQRLNLTLALEIDGIVIEGLVIRGRTLKDRPDEEVMFQLEYPQPLRRERGLERIDWRPLHTHNNQGRGPMELRFLQQTSSHRHAFDLNWVSAEGRMLAGNLPLAHPLSDEPATFGELLEFVKKSFRINNIGLIPPPPWEAFLF